MEIMYLATHCTNTIMSNFLKGTTLTSRRNYYLMLAAIWLYTFAPPVAGGLFFGFTGRVPLALQIVCAVWLVLITFAPLRCQSWSLPTATTHNDGRRITRD